jgi:O-antigen ligase
LHLLFVWTLALFDIQFFLASSVSQAFIRLVWLGYPPLLLMMALRAPQLALTTRPWVWNAPLLSLLAVAALTVPLAENRTLAKASFQTLLILYSMTVATAIYIRSARQAMPIITMMFAQFAWFAMFAGTTALVMWHPYFSNLDAFGTLMVQGVAICFWFGMATRSRWMKIFLFGLAGYCVLGVVASYARAAFLALVAVVGWIWLRSPRKLATGGGIVGAGIIAVAAASLIFEPGFFWNEITSAFEEGTTEGTGAQRWELWKAAFLVWMQRPIFGVGGGNFGAFAATHFGYGELDAFPNPGMLYGYNLHNGYMQVLSEFGIVGLFAFGWAIWDFLKRNRDLRRPEAVQRWEELGGGRWNLRYLSLGLEASNVANMLGAMFYASLFMPGFYTTWAVSRMLWGITCAPAAKPAAPLRRTGRVPSDPPSAA